MPARASRNWWSRLGLRPKLTLSFLMVSVPPVLIASFIAAQTMSRAFERNVDQWIGEIAQFMAYEAVDAQDETRHATSIIAAALSQNTTSLTQDNASLEAYADLLTSVGYDYVRLYDAAGTVLYANGELEVSQPLPREQITSIFFARAGGQPVMMVGAVQALHIGRSDYFLFVGDLLDEKFFKAPGSIRSLEVHLVEVTEGGTAARDMMHGSGGTVTVPPDVITRLRNGTDSVSQSDMFGTGPAVAYAALRDNRNRLVGIIVCRLDGASAVFERLGTWWLFLALASIAGLLSLAVGVAISRRLSAPLHHLSAGLKAVADGDYQVRIRRPGGREMDELANGFNAMTAQLETLRSLEATMRHRAQLATLGEAAAVIAHEIRNPLGIIKTSTELVRKRSAPAPAEDRLLGFVLDEVNRIERMVADLLDYVRPIQCERRPVDLCASVVRPVFDFASPELTRRGMTSALVLPDRPLMVDGDGDRLYQAILNLLLNAMDAATKDGHVIVRLSACDGMAVVEVEDNGPGVPDDMRERMFEPFITTKAHGTGLGLAKVQTTLQAHGGTIAYRHAPNGGAIFSLRLPLAEAGTGAATVGAVPAPTHGER
ncbi:hypothetical protein GCM10007301_07450 [Azorhizobium oxalatiphilum]|uniref:histidine kinase n=1 Tax=Azorhizobium oxalatiphilum TaxID=980631 RepID=A0A917BNW6_9HYPH|nr:ATP-binding protein [Azorhizobium oxalatiphilum]GGF50576.1 hypothetical protein GCM10007301_07450 [Azorhizobium oxalatiphilum]